MHAELHCQASLRCTKQRVQPLEKMGCGSGSRFYSRLYPLSCSERVRVATLQQPRTPSCEIVMLCALDLAQYPRGKMHTT